MVLKIIKYVICCKCKKLLGKLQPFRITKLFKDKVGEQKLYLSNDVIKLKGGPLSSYNFLIYFSPMNYFTPEEPNPTETTLNIIRQIAHTYRTIKGGSQPMPCCMN